jgi:hypothetical protein
MGDFPVLAQSLAERTESHQEERDGIGVRANL